ncbi:MAG: molybdate ABC transporter substrate-binding protein [Peptococcales bacterium]|jgi:molybdate transport system substrate-binding protein
MNYFKNALFLALVIALILFSLGCSQKNSQPNEMESSAALTVSAAASLKDVMAEIKKKYLQEKPNVTITFNFGASGSLQQQIEQGAEVDVFLSAATKQMNALQDKDLIIMDTRKDFLENKLVLIVPQDSAEVNDFKDLLNKNVKKIGIGEPKSVPVGQYAEELLTNIDIIDGIKSKVVYGKDVREVLTWVGTGNADAGIVYETDAKISKKVKIVLRAPEGSHKPVYYPAAVIKNSKNINAARDFTDFLYSSKAQPIFEKYGFAFIAE